MASYTKVDVSEQQLEGLVCQNAEKIEPGLKYIEHQRITNSGRLDVLMVDSGKSLVLAELKAIEDDGMLMQSLDYYDFISDRREYYARTFKQYPINPVQDIRLMLIAPSFSQTLITRCKWVNCAISLYSYQCLKLDKSDDVIPVFQEINIPSTRETLKTFTVEGHFNYITDSEVRKRAARLLGEARTWTKRVVSIDAIQGGISLKADNKVFAYLLPRRKHFIIGVHNSEDKWTEIPIHSNRDFDEAMILVTANYDRKSK